MSDLKEHDFTLHCKNCLTDMTGNAFEKAGNKCPVCGVGTEIHRLVVPHVPSDARLWAIAHKLGITEEELPGQLAAQIVDKIDELQARSGRLQKCDAAIQAFLHYWNCGPYMADQFLMDLHKNNIIPDFRAALEGK